MSVFAPTLGALWRQIEAYGLDPEPMFRSEGVDPAVMYDPGARIPAEQQLALFERALKACKDPLFGLKYAEYFRPAHLGALGFAWLASANLRTAFMRLHRYARVIQPNLKVELEDGRDVLHVTVDAHRPVPHPDVREDLQIGIIVKMCRIIAGPDLNATQICFQHSEPADTGPHYAVFRCPLHFGSDVTRLTFNRQDVDQRLTGSNDELAQLNEHIVVRYLAHAEKSDVVNRVKALIIDGLASGTITETRVAEQLHMTGRNLHRKLNKEGTSFKQILTEVRKDLAQQYIMDRSKTLTEISFLLGFAEVSSFSRAYKGWTGKPPSEARADGS